MPKTTTRGVLWDVLAPVLRWPLHSPARAGACLMALMIALCGLGAINNGDEEGAPQSQETSSTSTSTTSTSSTTSEPTTAPRPSSPSTTPTPTSSTSTATPSAPREPQLSAAQIKKGRPAVAKAARLADRLVAHRDKPRKSWWKRVKGDLSTSGRSQMLQRGPKGTPFTKVTGKPGQVVTEGDMGGRFTSVAVPTDRGTYLFLVEKSGVASISRMLPDDGAESGEGA